METNAMQPTVSQCSISVLLLILLVVLMINLLASILSQGKSGCGDGSRLSEYNIPITMLRLVFIEVVVIISIPLALIFLYALFDGLSYTICIALGDHCMADVSTFDKLNSMVPEIANKFMEGILSCPQ